MNNRQIVLEPTTQSFVDVMASRVGKPIYELSYADARQAAEDLQTWTKVNKLPADVEERILPVSPTGQISVTIYRPKGSTETLPVVMYFHGGGWVLCSKNTHDRLLRDLVNGTNAAFVFVNYTASPEAQFPIPVEQCFAATKYVAEHGSELGFDTTRLAIAGDSAGGNMAAVVTQLAKERKGPAISYQVLFYPVTDASLSQGVLQGIRRWSVGNDCTYEVVLGRLCSRQEGSPEQDGFTSRGDDRTTERPAPSPRYRRRIRYSSRRRGRVRWKTHAGRRRDNWGPRSRNGTRFCDAERIGRHSTRKRCDRPGLTKAQTSTRFHGAASGGMNVFFKQLSEGDDDLAIPLIAKGDYDVDVASFRPSIPDRPSARDRCEAYRTG